MIALNLARRTVMPVFTFLHTPAISAPMFSPSLSQSVHIMSVCARRASLSRFRAMVSEPFLTRETMGASKRTKGSHDCQLLNADSKSWSRR